MIDAGSRYRNLEAHVCPGVTLFLGTQISETMWTKLLPKSGKTFKSTVERVNNIVSAELAVFCSEIRQKVISHQLNLFETGLQNSRQGM